MHQSTLPFVRAATPPAKSAAAAPSTAPYPPPATSCKAPSARPPPGSRESTSAIPNGSTDFARRVRPSIFSICARNDSMAGSGRKLVLDLLRWLLHHVLYLFSNRGHESRAMTDFGAKRLTHSPHIPSHSLPKRSSWPWSAAVDRSARSSGTHVRCRNTSPRMPRRPERRARSTSTASAHASAS